MAVRKKILPPDSGKNRNMIKKHFYPTLRFPSYGRNEKLPQVSNFGAKFFRSGCKFWRQFLRFGFPGDSFARIYLESNFIQNSFFKV